MTRGALGSAALLAAVLTAAALVPAAAQEGSLEAEAGLSHARPPSGLDLPSATYGLLGLRVVYGEPDRGWLWGSGYGALSASSDVGDWASLTGGGEVWLGERSGLRLGLGGRASAFRVGAPDRFQAITGALFPQARYELWDDLTVRMRLLGGAGSSEVEITRQGFETGTVSTDLWYVGAEPGVTIRTPAGRLTGTAAYLDARTGIYRRAGLRYASGTASTSWSAGLELWDTPADIEVTLSFSLSLGLGGPWSAHAAAARSDPDPLLGSPASWQGSGMLAYELADLGPPPAVPLYRVSDGDTDTDAGAVEDRGAGADGARTVRFHLRAPAADEVVLLGDFTGWEPVSLERTDGAWTATVRVRPGVYHFGFRVDGEWHVPEDASGRVTDDWGRTNATLVVPAS